MVTGARFRFILTVAYKSKYVCQYDVLSSFLCELALSYEMLYIYNHFASAVTSELISR